MAGLLPTLDAKAGLELLLLAARDRGLDHLGPRVGGANLAPRSVGLEHELVSRDRPQHLLFYRVALQWCCWYGVVGVGVSVDIEWYLSSSKKCSSYFTLLPRQERQKLRVIFLRSPACLAIDRFEIALQGTKHPPKNDGQKQPPRASLRSWLETIRNH